jgi:hypothetical protein
MGYAVHKMPQIGEVSPGLWVATAFGGHGLNTSAMAGELIARAIAKGDDRWRLFASYDLVHAGGRIGRTAVKVFSWCTRLRDALDEQLAWHRAVARRRTEAIAARAAEEAKRRVAEEAARLAAIAEAERLAAIEAERQASAEAAYAALQEQQRQAAEQAAYAAAEEAQRRAAAEAAEQAALLAAQEAMRREQTERLAAAQPDRRRAGDETSSASEQMPHEAARVPAEPERLAEEAAELAPTFADLSAPSALTAADEAVRERPRVRASNGKRRRRSSREPIEVEAGRVASARRENGGQREDAPKPKRPRRRSVRAPTASELAGHSQPEE